MHTAVQRGNRADGHQAQHQAAKAIEHWRRHRADAAHQPVFDHADALVPDGLQFLRKQRVVERVGIAIVGQGFLHLGGRHESGKHLAIGRAPHRGRGAVAHGHMHIGRALFHLDDGRAVVAPDRHRHRRTHAQRQAGQLGNGHAHGVFLLQADQAQLHGQRAQAVVAGGAVLFDQAQLAKADQVRVRFGGRHPGGARQVFERHGPPGVHQRLEQLAAHLHALDAARGARWRAIGRRV